MQLSFGDAQYNGKRKQTRREIFLAEMDKVVPWKELLALIAPHYPKLGQPGRQPYPRETMLSFHVHEGLAPLPAAAKTLPASEPIGQGITLPKH